MHQSLAEWTFADHNRPVIILQRTGKDLRSGGRSPVDQHGKFHIRQQGVSRREILFIPLFHLSFRAHDQGAFRQEEIGNLYRLIQQSAPVTAKIEDKGLRPPVFQIHDRTSYIIGSLIREAGKIDIPDFVVQHPVIRNTGNLYHFPKNPFFQRFFFPDALQFKHHFLAGLSFQAGTHVLDILSLHVFPVNRQDQVAWKQSGLVWRRSLVGLADHHVIILHADHGTDPGVFARRHHLELVQLRFRVINRVRIQFLQHGVNPVLHHFLRLHVIHVKKIHVSEKRGKNIQSFTNLEPFIVFFQAKHPESQYQDSRNEDNYTCIFSHNLILITI